MHIIDWILLIIIAICALMALRSMIRSGNKCTHCKNRGACASCRKE